MVQKTPGAKNITMPTTFGRKLRNLRLSLAKGCCIFQVTEDCFTMGENDLSKPDIKYIPAIFEFLNYNPFEIDLETLREHKILWIQNS